MNILSDISQITDEFETEVKNLIALNLNNSLLEKIKSYSGFFLGRPYLLGALGEGTEGRFDQNPLYRGDAFDCLTYVNTVLALANSKNLSQFQKLIKKINYYEAKPSYQNRFHFMCVDWNRMNAQLRIIKDITQEWKDENGQCLWQWATADINKRNWFQRKQKADIKLLTSLTNQELEQRLCELHALADQQPIVESQIAYIPLNQLFKNNVAQMSLFKRLPEVSIIEIVRPNWDLREQIGTCLNVSHLGFAIWDAPGNQTIFRHASSLAGKVIEQPLIEYLQAYLSSQTIKGINIQRIISTSKRITRGHSLIEHLRGKASVKMTTDKIMRLIRDEE